MRVGLTSFMLLFCAALMAPPKPLRGQDPATPGSSTAESQAVIPATAPYVEPTESEKLHNYFFDAFGPYPMAVTMIVAGYHQATHTPPDWREGWAGYGIRYASDFGTSAINITARYTLAEALREDTMYYSCGCKGVGRRLFHAIVSTAIARRGPDGHEVFSVAGVGAPYIGPLVAVDTWYPRRYGPKDAFRMGNYGLMDYAIGNIGLEFVPGVFHPKRNSWIRRWHLDNRHAARVGESAP